LTQIKIHAKIIQNFFSRLQDLKKLRPTRRVAWSDFSYIKGGFDEGKDDGSTGNGRGFKK
jgi:hypothetical protein